jgi:D-2-hydroxyacid dehydrogenase (NADP+)
MTSSWLPKRVLVAVGGIPGFVDYLAGRRPDLELREVPLDRVTPTDVAWAEIYIGMRKPPVPSWGSVRWIHSVGAGVDKLLRPEPPPKSVIITRSPEDFGPAIGEWCLGQALAITQHHAKQSADQAGTRWNRDLEPVMLAGQRVLILGTGLVGRGIARAFKALGCSVRGLSRSGAAAPDFDLVQPATEFAEAVRETHWLILAAPSTRETRHFMDRVRLSQCGGAYLMNVGRGAVIDESVLPEAIDRGWIAGASLDVFEREPLDPTSPLWSHPKIRITPHISGPSTLAGTGDGFLECLTAMERGEKSRWVVDPDRGY